MYKYHEIRLTDVKWFLVAFHLNRFLGSENDG